MYSPLNCQAGEFNSLSCSTDEESLLKSVLKNDRITIEQLVEDNPKLLNHTYDSKEQRRILTIACIEENVEAETVQTLINLGADLGYCSTADYEKKALHFAAIKTRSDKIKVIVQSLKTREHINSLAKDKNALHVLICYGNSDSTEEFIECAKILLRNGINVNQGDGHNISPILWAAKKGFKEIIKIILEYSDIPVDLDGHVDSRKQTARNIILEKKLYDGVLPEKIDTQNESDTDILFKYLNSCKEDLFINFKNGDISGLVNSDNTSSTLLQVACERRLKEAVEHLLNKGADPNLTTSTNIKTPIELSAENGSYEIFYILLDQPKIRVHKSVIFTLLKFINNQQFPRINHERCYNFLLEKFQADKCLLDINATDEANNSALHYAVRYCESEKIEKLLQLGASLGSKGKYDIMPIHNIEPLILEQHLNNCIEFDLKERKFDKENFSVIFNYHTLIPPSSKKECNVSIKNNDMEANRHPKIKKELVFETEVIWYMSQDLELRHLLKHPVIVSFLFMKWHLIQWLFYTNLGFYIVFFLSLVGYIFSNSVSPAYQKLLSNISFVMFLVTYVMLVLRESFQITVSPNAYFRKFENYLEIVLIGFTGGILFINNPTDDTRRILSAVSILLAAFELVLIIGQHPKVSTNVLMLQKVSLDFFKFLMWYSVLIIAFALSFFILFSDSDAKASTNDNNDFFTDPGKSVFKTIVMLTGEFETGSLKFNRFPITSKLIFALFIFMIAIILLNLLNGLAVSDTQKIKNNAELFSHIARAQHIRNVESMLSSEILSSNTLKKLKDICCCFAGIDAKTLTITTPLAKRFCLFPRYLELKCYPNKGAHIYNNKKTLFELDNSTVRRTTNIIQLKIQELKKDKQLFKMLSEIKEFAIDNPTLKEKIDDIISHVHVERDSTYNIILKNDMML